MFAGNFGRQEVRAVERRVLLETLASKLPPGTISFSSKLKSIAEQGPDGTLLELEDGRQILSKVSDSGGSRKIIRRGLFISSSTYSYSFQASMTTNS